jgi:hypothetical protein
VEWKDAGVLIFNFWRNIMSNETEKHDDADAKELLVIANNTLEIAKEFKVTSQAMYEVAADELSTIKTSISDLTERRMTRTRKLDELKKLIIEDYAPALTRLESAKVFYQNGMIAYNDKQEKLRRAEQARLDAVARAERFKIEEAARKATEEAAKLQADAAAKAALAKTPEASAKIIAKAAEKIEAKQDEASALQLTSQVIVPATVAVAAKVSGTSVRKTWKAKVTDKAKFIQHVTAHPEFLAMIDINETLLNGMARAQQENLSLPGVQAYQESGIASRRN